MSLIMTMEMLLTQRLSWLLLLVFLLLQLSLLVKMLPTLCRVYASSWTLRPPLMQVLA